jgi:multimeric flavodoxin WrbA
MSILILNSSPRKTGNVVQALKALADGASKDHEIEWLDVYDLKYTPCKGCMKCRPDKECILPYDDAHMVGQKIKHASGLVIGTPTYWGNMSASLKGLFERNVPVFEYIDSGFPRPLHKGKKAVIVTACSAAWPFHLLMSQARGTIHTVSTILNSAGYKIISKIIIPNTVKNTAISSRILAKANKAGHSL